MFDDPRLDFKTKNVVTLHCSSCLKKFTASKFAGRTVVCSAWWISGSSAPTMNCSCKPWACFSYSVGGTLSLKARRKVKNPPQAACKGIKLALPHAFRPESCCRSQSEHIRATSSFTSYGQAPQNNDRRNDSNFVLQIVMGREMEHE